MLKRLKADSVIQKVNLEITYGKAVKSLVTSADKFAERIIVSIQKEIDERCYKKKILENCSEKKKTNGQLSIKCSLRAKVSNDIYMSSWWS